MITVESSGYFTTIQDSGRAGYRHLGVPVAGPMDRMAFDLAINTLPFYDDTCIFECTLIGPRLHLRKALRFVVTGATTSVLLNGVCVAMNKVHTAPDNSTLELGRVQRGIRSYLRFEAVLDTPVVLRSKSFYTPVTPNNCIQKGDSFGVQLPLMLPTKNHEPITLDQDYIDEGELNVTPGPDWAILSEGQQTKLLEETHIIEAQNRMGYRLSGTIQTDTNTLLSQLVLPGMVQLTPGGKLLVAMADCQVTGGYLQVLQLDSKALAGLSQQREGTTIVFKIQPT
jgi:biotin-dependent carboxylase-like uncharacterized protein